MNELSTDHTNTASAAHNSSSTSSSSSLSSSSIQHTSMATSTGSMLTRDKSSITTPLPHRTTLLPTNDDSGVELTNKTSTAASSDSPAPVDSQDSKLRFREILQIFNCAISQEQAWAVLYQILCVLKDLMENQWPLVRANQDNIEISVFSFSKDGSLSCEFSEATTQDEDENAEGSSTTSSICSEDERQSVEAKVHKNIKLFLRVFTLLAFKSTVLGLGYSVVNLDQGVLNVFQHVPTNPK